MPFDLSVTCTFMRGAKQKEMFEISDLRRKIEISDLRREILHLRSVCLFFPLGGEGGGGGTLIFSCIRRLGLFLGVQTFNFNIFWGFWKTEYFWGYEDFVDIFWVIIKLDYTLHFRVFSEGQST